MPNNEKIKSLGAIFQILADLCNKGYCSNMDDEVIDMVSEAAKKALDVNIGYESAQKLTGMGLSALQARMSRNGVKLRSKKLFPFSVLEKIGIKTNW